MSFNNTDSSAEEAFDWKQAEARASLFGGLDDPSDDAESLREGDVTPFSPRSRYFENASDEGFARKTSIEQDDALSEDRVSLNKSEDLSNRSRFVGDHRRYKRLIRHERLVWEGLQAAENDDLAAHVYNAHAIKQADYTADEQRSEVESLESDISKRALRDVKPYHSKSRWTRQGVWRPKESWTAWPLDPKDVPSEAERWTKSSVPNPLESGRNDYLRGGLDSGKPSNELEELVLVEMIQHARRRVELRAHLSTDLEANGESSESSSSESLRNAGRLERSEMEVTDVSSREQSIDLDQENVEVEESSESGYSFQGDARPYAFPADDHKAQRLLQPTVREILRQLDDLLMGLHRSRRNHVYDQVSDISVASPKGSDRKSHGRSKKRKRSIENGVRKTSVESSSANEHDRHTLHARDWSEVIGMSLLTGWDPKVVKRTAARCAKLFDEDMEFHTLEEHQKQKSQPGRSLKDQSPVQQSIEVDPLPRRSGGWVCPEERCQRQGEAFKSRTKWRKHIKEMHGYDYEGVETFIATGESGDLKCPLPSCKRGATPFPAQWRLNEHVKRFHPDLDYRHPPKRSPRSATPAPTLTSQSTDTNCSDEEMCGGVHVDGFLRPIKARKGWRGKSSVRSGSRRASFSKNDFVRKTSSSRLFSQDVSDWETS